jgi:hypothetical protein
VHDAGLLQFASAAFQPHREPPRKDHATHTVCVRLQRENS